LKGRNVDLFSCSLFDGVEKFIISKIKKGDGPPLNFCSEKYKEYARRGHRDRNPLHAGTLVKQSKKSNELVLKVRKGQSIFGQEETRKSIQNPQLPIFQEQTFKRDLKHFLDKQSDNTLFMPQNGEKMSLSILKKRIYQSCKQSSPEREKGRNSVGMQFHNTIAHHAKESSVFQHTQVTSQNMSCNNSESPTHNKSVSSPLKKQTSPFMSK
jgi:hypothetical protein